jgi:ATP-dependent helicase/nuclease subunit A
MRKPAVGVKSLSDEASRRAIREDLGTNILVEAGAGSGKTQMLAERMAAGIASGAYQVEHLAAVTFTRKAASELRGRFHLALERLLSEGSRGFRLPPSPRIPEAGEAEAEAEAEGEARVRAALANLERFFAGTIHSFCARLLRERPVESGVSPGFTELDEVQDEELRNRSWRDFITNMRSAGDRDMLDLLDTGVRPPDLHSAFAIICGNEDVEFPPGDATCPDTKAAWKALEKFWQDLQKHLPAHIDPETNCPIQMAALTFRGQMRVNRSRLDRPSVIASLLQTWSCKSEIKQFRWADTAAEKKRFRDLVNPLHEHFCAAVVTPHLAHWRQYVYRLSVTLLMRARDFAGKERRRRNSLNYGDLLNLTAKVLRENMQVRQALQQKYRHLFVDEFQDTDPVQAEIVFLLAANEQQADGPELFVGQGLQTLPLATGSSNSSRDEQSARIRTADREPRTADWRSVPSRSGALFVVGDPKQSIYRFRRADIEIYNIVRARFNDPAVGRVVPLTMNFRSVPALCEWANGVFDGPFPKAPTEHSPQFAPLDPDVEDVKGKPKSSSGLFTLTHAGESKEVPALDAAAIARYIRGEVDADRRKYSDFLILTRKKKDRIAPYAEALEELNIPIEVSGAGAFGKSEEVAALTVLLRALADPQDQLTLVNVLRGPLFGISDPELFEYKQTGGWFSIFATPSDQSPAAPFDPSLAPAPDRTADSGPRTAVGAALAALSQYYRWTRMLPAGAALDKILERTGYLALAATTPGGVEAGDLLHAVDRVRSVLEDGGNLADAADALAADSEASNEVESLPLEPGRSDVVRLMNLHKAKGLEAAVVFLADPCGGVNPKVDVHIERDGTRALGWFKVGRKYSRQDGSPGFTLLGEHKDWDQHEQAEQPFLDHEQTRLYYVAATRARDTLVVSRHAGNARSPAWGLLDAALASAEELPIPAKVQVASPKPATCTVKEQAAAADARAVAESSVNHPSWSITSATAEARHIGKIATPSATPAGDDPTRVVAQDTPSHRADAGMAWGTLIHGLLEHAMRHAESTPADLRRLAMWLTVEEPQLRAVIDEAIETVQRVAKAEFWAEAQAGEHSEEAPFTVVEGPALTSGVIDLLFESAGQWRVRDYKTDTALNAAGYEQQLETYREALRRVGCDTADAALVHVRDD